MCLEFPLIYVKPVFSDKIHLILFVYWLLFLVLSITKARSPSGKAEDCKSSIVGSIPTRASSL
jgi:hypothetical protein